jgi:hypothetical protein
MNLSAMLGRGEVGGAHTHNAAASNGSSMLPTAAAHLPSVRVEEASHDVIYATPFGGGGPLNSTHHRHRVDNCTVTVLLCMRMEPVAQGHAQMCIMSAQEAAQEHWVCLLAPQKSEYSLLSCSS